MSGGHGYSRYNRGCRCRECTDAKAAYQRDYARRPYPAELLRHGDWATYTNHGCRCDACREAARLGKAAQRDRQRAAASLATAARN